MSFRFLLPLAIALALPAQDQRPPGAGINFYSLDDEVALGAQLADTVRKNTYPVHNPAVQDYVTRLGKQLAAQSGGPDFSYTFSVISDAIPIDLTHEPIALPGGPIFVHTGLILEARSESEFAGMLAHAIAHVAERHYTRNMTRSNLMQIGAIAAAQSMPNGAQPIPLGTLQFQRAFELQADWLAVQMLSKAGYDPAALATYVQRTQTHQPGSISQVFSPLPPVRERAAAIQKAAAAAPGQTNGSGAEFAAIQDALRGK
jgi:predicted Zn-dependent protease